MGQCLVTKLKGVVNNDNLKKLGCIQFKKHATGNFVFTINGNGGDITVKCSDGRSFLVDSISVNTYTIKNTDPHQFNFDGSGYNIEISGKKNITNFGGSGAAYMMDISDLNGCGNLSGWTLNSPSYANGSIDDLCAIDSLTAFQFQVPGGLNGHIENLSVYPNIANLEITDNLNIVGDWCTLVRQIYAGGKTSGSIRITWAGSAANIKFNGTTVANTGAGDLAWSSNTGKITFTVTGTETPYEANL